MREQILELWPEMEWIEDPELREKTIRTWERAFELSPLVPADLHDIPFTLLVPDCPVTFMEHKRCVVHISRRAAESMREFMGKSLSIDMDTVVSGAILVDVGKLLEYEKVDGKAVQSRRGKYVRHPFTGVAVAMECGIPDRVLHVIATHAGEGNLVTRSSEAYIVHHADFMSFEPMKTLTS